MATFEEALRGDPASLFERGAAPAPAPQAGPPKSMIPPASFAGRAPQAGLDAPVADPALLAQGSAVDLTKVNEKLQDPNLDPVTRDRLLAQQALAGKFQIVGGDVEAGKRLPNQVSQEEFERMATLYSDVKLGSSDLQLDDAGMAAAGMTKDQIAAFRAGALNDLGDIMQTPSGRDL